MNKQQAALMSIASSTLLITLKLIVGLAILSVSLLSEALHSLTDLFAALIANYAVRKSDLPPDAQHQYGHGKYEDLSGIIEAILIFIAVGVIIFESLSKIINQTGIGEVDLGIAVMAVSMVADFLVSRKLAKVAEAEDSMALRADSLQLSTDVLASLGVLIGLVLIKLTGLAIIDPLIGILLALVIARAAWRLARETSRGLLDESLPPEEEALVRDVIQKHSPPVTSYHALRSRKGGAYRFIDLHLEMSGDMTLRDAHAVAAQVEGEIEAGLPRTGVTIHIGPSPDIPSATTDQRGLS